MERGQRLLEREQKIMEREQKIADQMIITHTKTYTHWENAGVLCSNAELNRTRIAKFFSEQLERKVKWKKDTLSIKGNYKAIQLTKMLLLFKFAEEPV